MASLARDVPGGWRSSGTRSVALRALLVALLCWIPASFLSARGGEFQAAQVIARLLVAFSPIWLLMIWLLVTRYRSAVAGLAVASTGMALLTLVLATDLRVALEPLGLASATGFALYAIPYAFTALAAWSELAAHSFPAPKREP